MSRSKQGTQQVPFFAVKQQRGFVGMIYESGNFDLLRELALPHKSPSWDDDRFAITGQRLTLRQSQSGSWDELERVASCRER
jgi:hypothetical protein